MVLNGNTPRERERERGICFLVTGASGSVLV